ncbi:MAG: hypothetical protein A2049_04605 [Elusimicrobia bacterium GWA2_62_23]|nr:MAG: hypothetical protein A2049_04605 [Elusimicrobia bacterium GWA2_62_23]
MDISPVTIRFYRTATDRCPFKEWLESLTRSTQEAVDARLTRVCRGLFGDHKHLGDGIFELRLHMGPGYRIYYGMEGRTLVILLEAGGKNTQASDITSAKRFWQDYLRRL